MPFWDRSLDLVVLTHPHDDHLAGLLGVLDRYSIGRVIEPPIDDASSTYAEWRRALDGAGDGTRVLSATRGQFLLLGDGVTLTVMHPAGELPAWTPDQVNGSSVVLRLAYGQLAFLLTGDITTEVERGLVEMEADLRATVLKVAHHGSDTSSSEAFLRAVSPALAVVSVSEENRFGHPDPAVVGRLTRAVSRERLLLTSERGDIEVTTDGRRLWLRTERGGS